MHLAVWGKQRFGEGVEERGYVHSAGFKPGLGICSFAHCSLAHSLILLKSNERLWATLSKSLRLLSGNDRMSDSLNKFWLKKSKILILVCFIYDKKVFWKMNESLIFAHFLWTTWAICSRSLTVAYLILVIWANERMSEFPALVWILRSAPLLHPFPKPLFASHCDKCIWRLIFGEWCERFAHNHSFTLSDVTKSLRSLTKNE